MNNMDKIKRLVFKFFDSVFRGYEKHGRRAINMKAPHVLFEYMNGDGRVAFHYDTETEIIVFNSDDFGTAKNMFGIGIPELVDICKEYVADKFGQPNLLSTLLYIQELNY
jgi:hypothetical protein